MNDPDITRVITSLRFADTAFLLPELGVRNFGLAVSTGFWQYIDTLSPALRELIRKSALLDFEIGIHDRPSRACVINIAFGHGNLYQVCVIILESQCEDTSTESVLKLLHKGDLATKVREALSKYREYLTAEIEVVDEALRVTQTT